MAARNAGRVCCEGIHGKAEGLAGLVSGAGILAFRTGPERWRRWNDASFEMRGGSHVARCLSEVSALDLRVKSVRLKVVWVEKKIFLIFHPVNYTIHHTHCFS